jgi:hypothetical protein
MVVVRGGIAYMSSKKLTDEQRWAFYGSRDDPLSELPSGVYEKMSASKEEIREAMKMLWDIDAEVVEALDSLIKEGLVEVEVEKHE